MAPSVGDTAANFYSQKNFGGDEYPYKIGDDESVPGELNDKFFSVNVGGAAKVIAWQHYSETGIYREWTGAVSDISDIGGLSRFKVVDSDTRAIAFIFNDATGGSNKQYSLKVNAADVGSVTVYSNEGDDYHLVGTMPSGGPPVTTAIYVRDEKSGGYIATGSVFFQWNSSTKRKCLCVPSPNSTSLTWGKKLNLSSKEVDIIENDNWPQQLKVERSGASNFAVTLIDNKPSE
jgi:hypothetical protein